MTSDRLCIESYTGGLSMNMRPQDWGYVPTLHSSEGCLVTILDKV